MQAALPAGDTATTTGPEAAAAAAGPSEKKINKAEAEAADVTQGNAPNKSEETIIKVIMWNVVLYLRVDRGHSNTLTLEYDYARTITVRTKVLIRKCYLLI